MERIMRMIISAGRRERRETREKINALIDAHIRTEDAMARAEAAIAELSEANKALSKEQRFMARAHTALAKAQANTDERLNAFIITVEKFIKERRNGST